MERMTAAGRVAKYLAELKKMRGMHQEEITALHSGDDREAFLLASDLVSLVEQAGRADRAERALLRAGFEDLGGQEWKPPLGKPPRFIEVPAAPAPPEVAVEQEPVAWQWRRKSDPWSLEKTFNGEVFATTPDTEVRPLYASPAVPVAPICDALNAKLLQWEAWALSTSKDEQNADLVTCLAELRAAVAVPVAAGLPAIPEGYILVRIDPTGSPYSVKCDMSSAAPVLPVEQPSQPQDQSGRDSALHAEPAGHVDAGVSTGWGPQQTRELFEDYALIAHLIGVIFFAGDFKAETANERELEALLVKTGHRYASWVEIDNFRKDDVPYDLWSNSGSAASGNTKPESSPIAEPDTATQDEDEGIASNEFLGKLLDWINVRHDRTKDEAAYDAIIDHINAWHQRATQAAKPLTDADILAALATTTHEVPKRLPPGWLKFARAIESHLKGE